MYDFRLDLGRYWGLSRRSYWAGGRWLMVDVLVETGLVRKLETFPELCHVETLHTLGDSGGNSSW